MFLGCENHLELVKHWVCLWCFYWLWVL